MSQFKYYGDKFDEDTDFVEYLRRATWRPHETSGPPDAISMWESIGRLDEALGDSPLGDRLRSAALTLIETGTPEEVKTAEGISYPEAPGAFSRLLDLLIHNRQRLESFHLVNYTLQNLLEMQPGDELLLGILRDEFDRAPSEFDSLVARFLPDYLAEHIPPLLPKTDVVIWLAHAPADKKRTMLDAIAAAGPTYVQRLVEQFSHRLSRGLLEEYRPLLASHPAFAAIYT